MDDESRKRQFDDFAGDSQESNHDTKEDDYSSSESDEEPLPPVPTAPRHFPEGESNRSVASREPTPKGGEESLENSQYEEGEEIEEEPTPGSRKFHGCSALAEYSVTEKIGEGTFGEVSIGRHKKSGDVVALKKILVHNEKEGIPVTALREIRILKALAHPNIIALKEIAYRKGDRAKKEKGVISMVFPYLDHDLTGLLENPAVRFKPPHIKSYMKQLLMGTNYLHKSHILHRDIKGSNILVDNKGNLKIADFGLARSYTAEDKKKYTNMVVTRWYRPPELLMGAVHYTTAIDIWGVGCVFGELLKRRPILPGSSDLDQLQKIFQLCGTPTDENWPDYKQLPNIANQSITLPFPEIHGRNIRTKFSKSQ